MILETQAASLWIKNLLARFSDLSEDQLAEFQQDLQRRMIAKFTKHWFEDAPVRGSAFRSLLIDSENNLIDELVENAASYARISDIANRLYFSGGIRLWIDPKEVAYASERGRGKSVAIIYKNGSTSPPSSPSSSSSSSSLSSTSLSSTSSSSSGSSTSPHRGYGFRRFHHNQQLQNSSSSYRTQVVQYPGVATPSSYPYIQQQQQQQQYVVPSSSSSSAYSSVGPACRPTDAYQSRAQLVL